MKNCISIFELVELGVLLGSVTFIIGLVFFLYLLKRIKIKRFRLTIYCILKLFISVALSIIIWHFWIFKIDIMFGCIFLPGVFAETITILLLYFGIKGCRPYICPKERASR
jgi:NAD/NADP transhydrogenase beta subunit